VKRKRGYLVVYTGGAKKKRGYMVCTVDYVATNT
jgi:hypothetical protein